MLAGDGKISGLCSSPRPDKSLVACVILTIAGLIQAGLLTVLFATSSASILVLIAITFSIGFAWYERARFGGRKLPGPASLALNAGGLGMLLGAFIDANLAAASHFAASTPQVINTLSHHHHVGGHLFSFMVLVMLVFCIPVCVVFCSNARASGNFIPGLCRHGFSIFTMLLAMLFLPALITYLMGSHAGHALASAPAATDFSPDLRHHAMMLAGMMLGSYFGYKIYDALYRRLPIPARANTHRQHGSAADTSTVR